MKIFGNPKLWGLILGLVIGSIVWQGLIIKQFADSKMPELWCLFGVTYMLMAGFYLKFDINNLFATKSKEGEGENGEKKKGW